MKLNRKITKLQRECFILISMNCEMFCKVKDYPKFVCYKLTIYIPKLSL